MRPATWRGLPIVIEHEPGSYREWNRPDGSTGRTLMRAPYGYFADHDGSDGDELDLYVGRDLTARFVYVVHQLKPDGARDEDKVIVDVPDERAAKELYLAHRDDGDRAYGGMSVIPVEQFLAKLQRRAGDGKIRHEMPSTARPFEAPLMALFDAIPKPGEVRSGVWDRFTTWGPSRKIDIASDGKLVVSETVFDETTLGQMVDNFVARGVKVPLDWNHQNAYAKTNGKPAESLARYACLATVQGGRAIKSGALKGYESTPVEPGEGGIWPTELGDGLYGFRCEVTPRGQEVLPNMAGISPMFSSDGVDEQSRPIGYVLSCVAATDVPFQGDRGDGVPGITFEQGAARANKGATTMPKKFDAKIMSRLGFAADSDDATIQSAFQKRMDAMAKFEGEANPEDKDVTAKFEDEARCMEEEAAAYEKEFGADAASPHVVMRRLMAKRFSRMAKMAAPAAAASTTMSGICSECKLGDHDRCALAGCDCKCPTTEMAKFAADLGIDPKGKSGAVLMDAIRAANVPTARVGELVKAQVADALAAERARTEGESKKRRAVVLTDALPKTYPGDRAALQRLAERDPDEALKLATPFLPPTGAPHLFERLTREGGPIDEPAGRGVRGAREDRPVPAPSVKKTKSGAIVFSSDAQLADKAKELADSKDPILMERLNALLPTEGDRRNPALRLMRAQDLAAEMYPELAEAAEQADLALNLGFAR